MSAKFIKYLMTPTTIVIHTNKGVKSINVGNPTFQKVREYIKDKDFQGALDNMDVGSIIFKGTNGVFSVVDGVIVYNGKTIPSILSETIMKFVKEKAPIKYLCNFWENLRRNPSSYSREQLYGFLKVNKVSITEDGCFIVYKIVSKDFKSLHDSSYNNAPGRTVTMPRDSVDPNPNQTCSRGLHVCAFSYVKDCYHWENGDERKLIECKVNPRHVVAIPTDYNNRKMRVCEYEVISEHRPHKGESPSETATYNFRTYYYKGREGKGFLPNLVTGKKPSRFSLTVRAKDTAEAVEKFKELV